MSALETGMTPLDAALYYAGRGWPVHPVGADKVPLTKHGFLDATHKPETIRGWWKRWPNAVPSIATGGVSGLVGIDIDNKPGADGFVSLELLGVGTHPETPTAHTPSGGLHMLFEHPGGHVKTVAGRLAPGIDVRGDGGSLILPPGPGRSWDAYLGPETPLLPLPSWARLKEPAPRPIAHVARPAATLEPAAERVLDDAVEAIIRAPRGQQEATLNGQCYRVGGLVASGAMPPECAASSLLWAARRMPDHDPRRPWRDADLDKKVRAALDAGMREPWRPRRAA